jgi:hypothetical protein
VNIVNLVLVFVTDVLLIRVCGKSLFVRARSQEEELGVRSQEEELGGRIRRKN